MKYVLSICLLLISLLAYSQNFVVPDQMEFAGIKLKIKEAARKDIQADVDALTRSEKYYLAKLSKVREYFPIIERIFAEEGLPEDFKYLVIQESAFIPDAVSTSNAVGFWQFKKETAEEVGLRVDSRIDERMHIIASTRGAARYIQKNNYFFNNWLNALQAYQMGAGGAMEVLGDKYSGAKSMTIDKDTYWYVKKFLAHKVAFEAGLQMYNPEANSLVEYTRGANKSLKEISKEVDVEEQLLVDYNKWLRTKKIPDENFIVIVPIKSVENFEVIASKPDMVAPDFDQVQKSVYPTVVESEVPFLVTINSLKGILAPKGSTLASLAQLGGVSVKDLLKYNELEPGASIIEDQIYYLEKKRNKGKIYFHTYEKGETLWSISQKYGIKASKIAKFNRLAENSRPADGLVLWLHKKRPSSLPPLIRTSVEEENVIVAEESKVRESRDLPTSSEIFEKEVGRIEATVDLNISPIVRADTAETPDPAPVVEPPQEEEVEESEEEERGAEIEVLNSAQSEVERPAAEKVEVSESEPKPSIIHKVEQGETLFSISRIYGITVDEIKDWNSIDDVTNLKMDQELQILKDNRRINDELDKSYTKHVVASGDTMYRISKYYNVSLDDLLKWNNKNSSELQIGETLLIKKDNP